MKSKQYNFILAPELLEKFEKYLKSKGFVFIASPATELPFPESIALTVSEDAYFPVKYLTLPTFKDQIIGKYIDTQNYYTLDVIASPVIELMIPDFTDDSKPRNRSRIFFATAFFNKEDELQEKDKQFIREANKVLNWCKRNFKNKY